METPHNVAIVGGGFGGLFAARALKRSYVHVTLIDRRNFHLFQPLLYQVATGGLSAANIAAPLRVLLKRRRNTEVRLGEVVDIDVANHQLVLTGGEKVGYDTLIVAAGSAPHYFGHDKWREAAPPLKSIADADEIRRRVLLAFEAAEAATDAASRRTCLTFVVVGGGTTGVELTGCLSELAHHTLNRNFRHIDPGSARVLLVEGGDRVLPSYPSKLSAKAAAALTRLGVEIQTGAIVTGVEADAVTLRRAGRTEHVGTRTILWAAGVQASPLGRLLAEKTGAEVDKGGRIVVQPDLTVPGHPALFVLGDLARFDHQGGRPLPGVAPVAMQQGRYAAKLIESRLRGKRLPPFHYKDRGSMAVIGRNAAVADLGWLYLSGFPAWLLWLFIHLLYLVPFQNRLLVLMQWAWSYITRNRSALLIPERTLSTTRAGTYLRRTMMKATQTLHELGQSLWLDNITRGLLTSGTLGRYIQEFSITGLTSNPTIFDHAIENSHDYDDGIWQKVKEGKSAEALFFELAIEDLGQAADLFRPIHDQTNGVDGWVSLEVSPLLAHDTAGTLAAAKELHARAGRPNLFIKIPGTREGVPAIEEAIFAGVPINVTLLFSREQYVAAAEAYLRGIERRIAAGLKPEVGSVASMFISRWDVAVMGKAPEALRDQLGIAVAGQTYETYRFLLDSPRWQRILNAGARRQRLLWASTGTKDPKASDSLYIQALAAPFTVNTMPEATLKAFADHGEISQTLPARARYCDEVLAKFANAGIDTAALAARLQDEGATAFVKSWKELLECIASKSAALKKAG